MSDVMLLYIRTGGITEIMKMIKYLSVIFMIVLLFVTTAGAEETTDGSNQQTSVFILGDVNSSGNVSAADARLAFRFSEKVDKAINIKAADYNKDKIVNDTDTVCILRFSAGLEFVAETVIPDAEAKIIEIPAICQFPDYPSGCESVSTVMNLNYLGYDITIDEFIYRYLPGGEAPHKKDNVWYSGDPNKVFLGDPKSSDGWGIWAKGLYAAVRRYMADQKISKLVTYTYYETLESLCDEYVKNDIPVIVWVTVGMQDSYERIEAVLDGTNRKYTWISPNHCMLLVGFDSSHFYFNDPTTGKVEKYGREEAQKAFSSNGSQAVIIK